LNSHFEKPTAGDQEGEQAGRLARLMRDGLVRPHRNQPSMALFSSEPPRARKDLS